MARGFFWVTFGGGVAAQVAGGATAQFDLLGGLAAQLDRSIKGGTVTRLLIKLDLQSTSDRFVDAMVGVIVGPSTVGLGGLPDALDPAELGADWMLLERIYRFAFNRETAVGVFSAEPSSHRWDLRAQRKLGRAMSTLWLTLGNLDGAQPLTFTLYARALIRAGEGS